MIPFPKACGGWYHLPRRLLCDDEPGTLISALGGRLGNPCGLHADYRHFRPPVGWKVAYQPGGLTAFDAQLRQRLDLRQDPDEPPRLTALPFYRAYGSWEHGPRGWVFIHGRVVSANGQTTYTAFQLMRRRRMTDATFDALGALMLNLLGAQLPDITNPLAHWD